MATFYGNQHRNSKWQSFKRKVKKTMIVSAALFALYWAAYIGSQMFPRIAYAEKPVYVTSTSTAPILLSIADCESGDRDPKSGYKYAIKGTAKQIDPKTGQVFMKANKDGTIDVGYFMINSVNFKEANKLGYDVTTESGNKAYGQYLYQNRGSEPWYSSKSCWNK